MHVITSISTCNQSSNVKKQQRSINKEPELLAILRKSMGDTDYDTLFKSSGDTDNDTFRTKYRAILGCDTSYFSKYYSIISLNGL